MNYLIKNTDGIFIRQILQCLSIKDLFMIKGICTYFANLKSYYISKNGKVTMLKFTISPTRLLTIYNNALVHHITSDNMIIPYFIGRDVQMCSIDLGHIIGVASKYGSEGYDWISLEHYHVDRFDQFIKFPFCKNSDNIVILDQMKSNIPNFFFDCGIVKKIKKKRKIEEGSEYIHKMKPYLNIVLLGVYYIPKIDTMIETICNQYHIQTDITVPDNFMEKLNEKYIATTIIVLNYKCFNDKFNNMRDKFDDDNLKHIFYASTLITSVGTDVLCMISMLWSPKAHHVLPISTHISKKNNNKDDDDEQIVINSLFKEPQEYMYEHFTKEQSIFY